MKFIHAADLHLDSPLRGLERYEGAPVEAMRVATRRAFENTVALALEEGVDLFLIAGDVYDGDWRDYNTGLFFARQMSRLRDAGIPVVLIRGNHDAASQISRELNLPDNVRLLSSRKCETVRFEDLGVAVHGQGFLSQAITDDLSQTYPTSQSGFFNIGLLHTSADGREGHENYAPCSRDGLLSKGYDYWALGHVHQREVLHQEPWIIFSGSLQGRHARELGDKGCTLVTVDHGRVRSVEHRSMDVARWCQCLIPIQDLPHFEDVLEAVQKTLERALHGSDGRVLAIRLVICGSGQAHAELTARSEQFINQCRVVANDVGGGQIWVEKVKLQTQALLVIEELLERQDPLGDLARYLRSLHQDTTALTELLGGFKEIRKKLPLEIRTGHEAIDLDHPEALLPLLADVEQILLPRLLDQKRCKMDTETRSDGDTETRRRGLPAGRQGDAEKKPGRSRARESAGAPSDLGGELV